MDWSQDRGHVPCPINVTGNPETRPIPCRAKIHNVPLYFIQVFGCWIYEPSLVFSHFIGP